MIKKQSFKKNIIGEILKRFEANGLKIKALKMVHLSKTKAEGFYAVHKERPFFDELTTFMSSGPVVISVLEGENAIAKNREIMGATNPADADAGTIRKDFSESVGENTVHGSEHLTPQKQKSPISSLS